MSSANVAAPEIRAFIEGSESPPIAPRPTSPPIIRTSGSLSSTPVDFSPLTCEPGGWSGSPSYTYTFQTETADEQVLQSGSGNVFTPPASLLGVPLVCVVQAHNPGGVATNRSATTATIVADTSRPSASVASLRCRLRTCTLAIAATDPNDAALKVTVTASHQVIAKCHPQSGRRPMRARHPVCHKTDTAHMAVGAVSAGLFKATESKLPYDKRLTFAVLVTNAAGLRPAKAPARSTTLHPPKPAKKRR